MKYRKIPVTIHAWELTDKLCEYLSNNNNPEEFPGLHTHYSDRGGIYIDTLEGTMFCGIGDYIIKGVNGEYYPCKHDIFWKTYEAI